MPQNEVKTQPEYFRILGQSQHQLDVLDRSTGGAFAKVIEARDQHSVAECGFAEDIEFEFVAAIQRQGVETAELGGIRNHRDVG